MSNQPSSTPGSVTDQKAGSDEAPPTAAMPLTPQTPEAEHESEPQPFASLGDDELKPRSHHVVDRFDGALGLLLLRLVTAAVLGVRGWQKVRDHEQAAQMLRAVRFPAYDVLGLLLGPVQLAMAAALVVGLGVRIVGAGVAASAVTALVLVNWASGSVIFPAGGAGFNGDFQLLLAGVGVALLGLGGGGLGLDRAVRNRGTMRR